MERVEFGVAGILAIVCKRNLEGKNWMQKSLNSLNVVRDDWWVVKLN